MRFLQKSARYFADTVFPPTKQQLLVRQVTSAELICKVNPRQAQGVINLLPYADPVVSALIQEAKFYNSRAYDLLASALANYLKNYSKPIVLLPVPLSATRYRERGYNQVTEVARRVAAKHPAWSVDTSMIIKWQHTRAQTSLTKVERLSNVKGVFRGSQLKRAPPPYQDTKTLS